MRTSRRVIPFLVICTLALVLGPACAPDDEELDETELAEFAVTSADGSTKAVVCHVQGDTPHEIEVGFSSVRSHLSHGDFLGPCELPPGD